MRIFVLTATEELRVSRKATYVTTLDVGCAARFRFRSETGKKEAKIISLRRENSVFSRLFRMDKKQLKFEDKLN